MATLYDDKCTGAFLAAAIGDALGWPFERRAQNKAKKPLANGLFQRWTRQAGGRFWAHTEQIERGEYSDDTQMLLIVARSMLYGEKWNQRFVKQELPFWVDYERGGGNALKSAARAWQKGSPWSAKNDLKEIADYFNAGANGVAMRILPHVVYQINSDDIGALMETVLKNGMYTHGHPRALVGATCYAYALYAACRKTGSLNYGELVSLVLEGKDVWGRFRPILPEWKESADRVLKRDYAELWYDTVENVCHELKRMRSVLTEGLLDNGEAFLDSIGCFSPKTNGAGDVSALTAIYFASRYAANPRQGVLAAAYLERSDTDTNAAMTGALLGMIQGASWIPLEWLSVQDRDYIASLPAKLLAHAAPDAERPREEGTESPIGALAAIGSPQIYHAPSYTVSIQKYKTAWGQTLYLKTFSREKSDTIPERAAQCYEMPPLKNAAPAPIDMGVLSALEDIFACENRLSVAKLISVIRLTLTSQMTDREIAEITKVKQQTVAEIRSKCKNKK